MSKILQKIKDTIVRIIFWIPESQVKLIRQEVKKGGWKNESILLRHIIGEYFKK